MNRDGIPPLTAAERARQAGYDALHAARSASPLTAELYARAMGDAYPREVDASSSCDWPLLGALIGALRMSPHSMLVDLGCGTGGVGLWLARALDLRLTGIDLSGRAVGLAARRAPGFLPPGRACFRIATVERTRLADASAHGVVSVDALAGTTDRQAALAELRRILVPGARAAITCSTRSTSPPAWEDQAAAVGLDVEAVQERPEEPRMWARLYRLWQTREQDLIRELGVVQAQRMLAEADTRLPTLAGRRAVLLTLRRPLRCTHHTDTPEGTA